MSFRKLLTTIVYTCLVLLIGRNLTLLPKVSSIYNPVTTFGTDELKQQIMHVIKQKPGHYSVYVSDFKSPLSFGINEHTVLTGASVNKVPIVAVLYYLAQKGKLSLDQKIVLQKDDIQDYGTGSLRYQQPGGTYSLKTLAKLTLQESDNTAAHILGQRLTMDTIQTTITHWGLTQTDMADNKTSLTDMELLYRKIYTGQITSKALTKELLGFMRDTETEDRLPDELPDDAIVYHKTGDAIGSVHDVGIITGNGQTYFIGVMTSDIGDTEQETKQTIATISKMVYDFMKNKE
jgi:beta-lactamase class A